MNTLTQPSPPPPKPTLLLYRSDYDSALGYSLQPEVAATLTTDSEILVGDFDGDGWTDFVSREILGTGNLKFFRNNGSGVFAPGIPIGAIGTNIELIVGDFTGDGKADVVGRNLYDSGTLYLYQGNGGGFSYLTSPGVVGTNIELRSVDVNGDGAFDLIGRNKFGVGDIYIYLSQGTQISYAGTAGPIGHNVELLYGDVNGDKRADIVGRNSSTGELYLHLGTGSGFSYVGSHGSIGTNVEIQLGNVKGDPRQEIVALDKTTLDVYLFSTSARFFDQATRIGSLQKHADLKLLPGRFSSNANGDFLTYQKVDESRSIRHFCSASVGPQSFQVTQLNYAGNFLHLCSHIAGLPCPEMTTTFPSVQSLDLHGMEYTDTIPDTLDLVTWAREYYHGTLALMLPTDFIATMGTIGVPRESFAPAVRVLYHKIMTPEGEQKCSNQNGAVIPGPCIDASYVPQWGVILESLRRTREMIGNTLEPEDKLRELLSMRGLFAYDQQQSASNLNPTPGDVNSTAHYSMMLLTDLYRQYPQNAAVVNLMNEYIRYKSTTMGTNNGIHWFWFNKLLTETGNGFDAWGGYFNNHYLRVHFQALGGKALAEWANLTGDPTALDLGKKVGSYLLNYENGIFWRNPNPQRFPVTEARSFVGHTLSYATGLEALLSDAEARLRFNPADPVARQEVDFVQDVFEFAKKQKDLGVLGNFGVTSYIGVLMSIGTKLEKFRLIFPDIVPFSSYYEDMERWMRNQVAESRIDEKLAAYIPNTPHADPRFDRLRSRAKGTFVSAATHITALPLQIFQDANDGVWLMRGLYDVWKNSVEVTNSTGAKVAWVNFLLNHASPYMDVYSDIPYRGRVKVRMQADIAGISQLAIRVPSWAGQAVTVREDSAALPHASRWQWVDRYVLINQVKANSTYTVEFPLVRQDLTVAQLYTQNDWWHEGNFAGQGYPETVGRFGATFIGDTMIKPATREDGPSSIPRYQRSSLEALLSNASPTGVTERPPPIRSATRFVQGCR